MQYKNSYQTSVLITNVCTILTTKDEKIFSLAKKFADFKKSLELKNKN